jgi:hypothetical protein
MALILKQGKTYSDPYDGSITTAYANVKKSERDVNSKRQSIDLDIYSSKQARLDKRRPVETRRIEMSSDAFDTHFSEAILSESGKSVESQAYVFLLSLVEYNQDWQGDE